MKGIERAEEFFNGVVLPAFKAEFGSLVDEMAFGLVGHGSECFGFDDDVSTDHDFGGFDVFITEAGDKEYGFRLFRAYEKIMKDAERSEKSAAGGRFRGVKTIGKFYEFYLGRDGLPESNREWLSIPDFFLAEATNGKVFSDKAGEFTRIRNELISSRPEDVRLKKLASAVFYMAQAGQYNYSRCARHGEKVAAGMALNEFVKSAMDAAFLLERKYAPYYKWTHRAMKTLGGWEKFAKDIESLFVSPYDFDKNAETIETIAAKIRSRLIADGYVGDKGDYLEPYAFAVNDLIADGDMRNSPIML